MRGGSRADAQDGFLIDDTISIGCPRCGAVWRLIPTMTDDEQEAVLDQHAEHSCSDGTDARGTGPTRSGARKQTLVR